MYLGCFTYIDPVQRVQWSETRSNILLSCTFWKGLSIFDGIWCYHRPYPSCPSHIPNHRSNMYTPLTPCHLPTDRSLITWDHTQVHRVHVPGPRRVTRYCRSLTITPINKSRVLGSPTRRLTDLQTSFYYTFYPQFLWILVIKHLTHLTKCKTNNKEE